MKKPRAMAGQGVKVNQAGRPGRAGIEITEAMINVAADAMCELIEYDRFLAPYVVEHILRAALAAGGRPAESVQAVLLPQ